MGWVIEITKKLHQGRTCKFYVTTIKRCGTGCSLTTSFDAAKVYKNRKYFQKLLDFFEQSGIAYKVIPDEDKG